jgi:hypothetical protein
MENDSKYPDFSRIILMSEQPTTCPICSARTEFLLDFSHTTFSTQIHKCLSVQCLFEFVVQDEDKFIEEFEKTYKKYKTS